MAIISAFQAEDESSILFTRSKLILYLYIMPKTSIISKKIKIRNAKLSDAIECLKLTKTPEFIFPGNDNFLKKYLNDFIKKGIFFVAERENKIMGFISAQVTLGKELWVDMLVVDKKERRQGIGTKLIKFLLGIAKEKGMKMVFLDAPAFNKETIKFYRKLGFKKEKKFIWFTKEFHDV